MTAPTTGLTVMVGKLPTTFEVLAKEVDGAYSVVRHQVPPGVLTLPHTHQNEDQVAVGVTGRLGVLVGDRAWEIGPGEIAVRPRGLVHTVWNSSGSTVEFLEVTSPGGFEDYFFALAELTASQSLDQAPALAAEWKIAPDAELAVDLERRYPVRR